MRHYAGGDVRAFEELYERWDDRVFGFCLRYLGDRDAAADAFQETWRRVVDAREEYEPRGRFRSWLFTLARRSCVDRVRRSRDASSLSELVEESGGEGARDALGRESRTEERVGARSEVGRLLALLTPEQREVLLLAKAHDFSYREIAELTGSTEAAVKQMAYRALKKLRSRREDVGEAG